jgi:pimeloyl-ACP methyl ester carboxylesterase
MKYKEFGNKKSPTIILLHGGGLSWWSLKWSCQYWFSKKTQGYNILQVTN